jgi:hypothetical protein
MVSMFCTQKDLKKAYECKCYLPIFGHLWLREQYIIIKVSNIV